MVLPGMPPFFYFFGFTKLELNETAVMIFHGKYKFHVWHFF